MELFWLYLWMKMDALHSGIAILTLVGSLLSLFTAFFITLVDKWHSGNNLKYWRRLAVSTAVFGLLALVIPTSNQIAGLVAAKLAINASESPEAQKLGIVLRKKANEYLDEQLKGK